MSNYPLPTELFFKHLRLMSIKSAIKLFIFVISAEVSIMALFSYFSMDMILSPLLLRLADGGLLALMVVAPFYVWMFKPAMEAIEGSQNRLNVLSNAVKYAGDGIMITDRTGKIEYINQALRDILHCENEDIIGKQVSTIDAVMASGSWRRNFMHEIYRNHVWHDEQWGERRNGEKYLARVTVTPIRVHGDGKISNFITIIRDQTDHHALEMKYHQAQKMEAVGTLVGGIAHDFNNMLSSLTGHIYMIRAQLKKSSLNAAETKKELFERLSQIETLGMHAAEMIQQLLTFARKGNVEKTALALPSFMKEALKLAEVSLPANIHFKYSIHHEEMTIFANATQLQQVLMNLINNAKDAVAGVKQPKISVSLNQVDASHARLQVFGAPAGMYVEICVTDNGCGIDQAYISRVMEPFFTTKDVGKGTGLGLAMVYGIVKEHRGYIDINSQPQEGTAMHLFFPVTERSRAVVKQTEQVYQGAGETILLVEDQQDLRQSYSEVLESLGYAVLEAKDGVDAMEVYARHTTFISAVISDMVMPRMQGAEFACRIKQQNPHLPVMLISGYYQEEAHLNTAHQYVDIMLSKPFSIPGISYALHSLLHEQELHAGLGVCRT